MKINVLSFLIIALFTAAPVYASEVTGTLSTGVETGLSGIVDAPPVANPLPGTYTSGQSVTLTATDSDSIHYTTDGTTNPTCTTGTTYASAINVSTSITIRAVVCFGTVASPVGIFAYGINIAAPAAPSGGGGGGGGGGGSPAPVVGDFNGDAHIDLTDFNSLVVAWGKTGSGLAADLNHDGVVDLLDLNLLFVHWTG